MVSWYKLIDETVDKMTIAYSLEENQNCDGVLIFDKNTQEMSVVKATSGKYAGLVKHYIGTVRSRIRKGMEVGKKYMVATG